jgi:hypothetical protein
LSDFRVVDTLQNVFEQLSHEDSPSITSKGAVPFFKKERAPVRLVLIDA